MVSSYRRTTQRDLGWEVEMVCIGIAANQFSEEQSREEQMSETCEERRGEDKRRE